VSTVAVVVPSVAVTVLPIAVVMPRGHLLVCRASCHPSPSSCHTYSKKY
jgi:hypothetical protein